MILAQRHVPHVENAVLYPPMIAHQSQQPPRIGPPPAQRRDPINRLAAGLSANRPLPHQLEHLRRLRPVQITRERHRAAQRPPFQPPVSLVQRGRLRALSRGQPPLPRGKGQNRHRLGRWTPSTPAECPSPSTPNPRPDGRSPSINPAGKTPRRPPLP